MHQHEKGRFFFLKRIYLTVDNHLTEINTLEKGCWVHLHNPTREEIDGLNARFHLEPTYLQAALDEEESARIERDGDQMLIIVDIPYIDDSETGAAYTTIPMGIVIVDDVIITVSTRESTVITDFTEERIRGFWTFKRTRFLLQILQRTASRYLTYLKQIDKSSQFVQKRLEKDMRNQELLQMMKLEKSLVFFSTSLKGNEMVMERMLRTEMLRKYPEDGELLEDVIIENKQAMEMCSIYRNIISSTMDAFASIISNNLNIVMKVLTSLTVVLSIPTLFASLWGMNVGVPFQNNPFGFWIVIAITAVASLAAFIILWRRKMF